MNENANDERLDYHGEPGHRIAIRQQPASPTGMLMSAEKRSFHIVFCGGFHSSMLGLKASALAKFCQTQGFAFTRFDYRGHGESEGSADTMTLHEWLSDTLLVLDQIEEPVVLVGSSMGAWLATLAAAKRPKQVHGLLLLAAAPDFLQRLVEARLTAADIWELQQGRTAQLANNYEQPYPVTQALLDSGKELSVLGASPAAEERRQQLKCPVRLIHGTSDSDVPYQLAVELLESLTHKNAELILLNQADHRLSDSRSLECVERTLTHLIEIAQNNTSMPG